MAPATVAIVATDPSLRVAVAQAFDAAPQSWAVSFCDSAPPDADVLVFAQPRGGDPGPSSDASLGEAGLLPGAARTDAVLFDPGKPESLIPQIQARLERPSSPAPCRVVAVTGIAGAGVTSVAAHLGLSWAARFQTCFIDLDRTWTCADRLGLGNEVVTWASAGESAEALRLASVPITGGLRALVAPRTQVDAVAGALLQAAGSQFQRLVVDLPWRHLGSDRIARPDAAIVVMGPCVPHAHRVARMLAEVDAERVLVVTNRLGRGGETTRSQLEAIMGRKLALELPCCPGLRDAEGKQRLLPLKWSRWGHAIVRLARALDRT
jgi:CO dehydrogenase nickel-insertion accessory protein CooC1